MLIQVPSSRNRARWVLLLWGAAFGLVSWATAEASEPLLALAPNGFTLEASWTQADGRLQRFRMQEGMLNTVEVTRADGSRERLHLIPKFDPREGGAYLYVVAELSAAGTDTPPRFALGRRVPSGAALTEAAPLGIEAIELKAVSPPPGGFTPPREIVRAHVTERHCPFEPAPPFIRGQVISRELPCPGGCFDVLM
ncbi:MAG: hypothetical protein NZ533_10965 [Casimicrobiaceae bacterium]|nr:hypothetical protein [Casimicrobiaceae bacterium]MDW8313129.1 hypothetical protein [Burkholderiales bacterium]